MEGMTEIAAAKMFGGYNKRYRHYSTSLGCPMTFYIYFPPASNAAPTKLPVLCFFFLRSDRCWFAIKLRSLLRVWFRIATLRVLYWLSGLTCSDENFIVKSGAQRAAAAEGVALVAPDTSPRGLNVEGEADSWDFGVGAGFYLNATQEKWKNWQMYDYVVKELPELLEKNFPNLDVSCTSIFGHSMGGHGALTIYLKNPDKYKSVSAFAPITNPINCPWGQKAFSNYLGDNKSDWEDYDATCLVAKCNRVSAPILIDQGEDDKFLHDQLLPHKFVEACKKTNAPVQLRMQRGYDHSYFFISTFIDDHIQHHVQAMRSNKI